MWKPCPLPVIVPRYSKTHICVQCGKPYLAGCAIQLVCGAACRKARNDRPKAPRAGEVLKRLAERDRQQVEGRRGKMELDVAHPGTGMRDRMRQRPA